jgi:hypothetical protein
MQVAPPETKGGPHTTITLGIIFAARAAVPVETLAEEHDRMIRQKQRQVSHGHFKGTNESLCFSNQNYQ